MSIREKFNSKHTLFASCVGYIVQAVVNNLSPLFFAFFSERLGISLTKLALLITMNFVLQIGADIFGSMFIDKIGYRKTVVFAEGLAMVGLIMLSLLPNLLSDSYLAILLSTVFTAIGGGLIEVVVSPIVEAIPGERKSSTMGLLHSFYCWGQALVILLSTLYIAAFGIEKWYVLPALWAIVPLFGIICFLFVPMYSLTEEGASGKIGDLLKGKLFRIIFILMICSGACELAMAQWASFFAEVGLGISKALGDLLGPCAFALFMGGARIVYSKHGEKLGLERCLILAFSLSIIGYLLTALSPIPAFSLVGCALCGIAAAPMWPATYSLGAKRIPKGGTAMFALLALGGDLGCTVGPDIVGMISDAVGRDGGSLFAGLFGADPDTVGLKVGMLAIALIPLFGLISVFLLNKRKKEK